MRLASFLALAVVLSVLPATTKGQTPAPPSSSEVDPFASVKADVEAFAKSHPDVINEKLRAFAPTSLRGFLTDTNLRFKYFDPNGSQSNGGLGFEYSLDKSLVESPVGDQSDNPLGLSLNVKAKGNVAFDQSINPTDFLDTSLQVHLFQTVGGVAKDWTEIDADELQAAAIAAAKDDGSFEKFERQLARVVTTQFFWDFSGHASLESNQDFSSRQMTYGLLFGGSIGAWNPESPWSKFNPFDLPFRLLLRPLLNAEGADYQSGRSWPVVLAGIDGVDPSNNEVRLAVDPNRSMFSRFRTEVAFRTLVMDIGSSEVWFSTSYRYFQEIDASAKIKSANLDHDSYLVTMLELPYGISVSYASGKLPLDEKNDEVFELGYTLKIPPALLQGS